MLGFQGGSVIYCLFSLTNAHASSFDSLLSPGHCRVDSHKAAYIPICIAGGASTILTAEPALTMPHENDANMELPPVDINAASNSVDETSLGWAGSTPEIAARATNQKGAQLRRFGTRGSYE